MVEFIEDILTGRCIDIVELNHRPVNVPAYL